MDEKLFAVLTVFSLFIIIVVGPVRASWDSECEAMMPSSVSGYPLDSSHIVRGTAAHGCYHAYQIGNPDLTYPFVKEPSGVTLSCGAYGTGIGPDLAGEVVQVWIKYDERTCYSVEQSNALAAELIKYLSGRLTFDVEGVTIIEQAHTDTSNHVYAGYSFYLGHYYVGVLYEHVGAQTDSQRREKPIEAIRQVIQKIKARESCAIGGVATQTPTATPAATEETTATATASTPTPALTSTPTPIPTATVTATAPAKKSDGESCYSDSECASGNCRGIPNGVCCMYGKQCCRASYLLCAVTYECGPDYYCVPESDPTSKKENGFRCISDSRCLSGHCQNGRCCDAGKTCCTYSSDCPDGYYCGSFSTCTIDQRANGHPCTSDAGCLSEWCSLSKCADKREIVVSAGPETEPEAAQIKRMIEKDIYPAIVAVFGEHSEKAFTGPRDYDYEIKLQLVFDTPTAMWDEATNTLHVPTSNVYEGMGAYSPKMMQLSAIAHELTHYYLNGFALKAGGDFGKVPLWFREGLAEYGAHAFYKNYMMNSQAAFSQYLGAVVIPPTSVSEAREIRFRDYMSDGSLHYKETVESDALDKISWLSEASMDTRLSEYAHLYYGAAFSFVNYLAAKSTYQEKESMMDVMKYMFVMGSKGNFKFYAHAGDEKNPYDEKSIKKGWYEQFINKHEIDTSSLKSRPGLIKAVAEKVGSIFRGLLSSIFGR